MAPRVPSASSSATAWRRRCGPARPPSAGRCGSSCTAASRVRSSASSATCTSSMRGHPLRPLAYLSSARFPSGTRDLVVRASGDPTRYRPVTALARRRDRTGRSTRTQVESMADAVDVTLASERFTAFVLSAFAVIASLLGGVGVFGVIAQRRRPPAQAKSAFAWRSARRRVDGIVDDAAPDDRARRAISVAGARCSRVWLARSMTTLLFGVTPADPASHRRDRQYVLVLAAVATSFRSVRRLRRSPLAALREILSPAARVRPGSDPFARFRHSRVRGNPRAPADAPSRRGYRSRVPHDSAPTATPRSSTNSRSPHRSTRFSARRDAHRHREVARSARARSCVARPLPLTPRSPPLHRPAPRRRLMMSIPSIGSDRAAEDDRRRRSAAIR